MGEVTLTLGERIFSLGVPERLPGTELGLVLLPGFSMDLDMQFVLGASDFLGDALEHDQTVQLKIAGGDTLLQGRYGKGYGWVDIHDAKRIYRLLGTRDGFAMSSELPGSGEFKMTLAAEGREEKITFARWHGIKKPMPEKSGGVSSFIVKDEQGQAVIHSGIPQ